MHQASMDKMQNFRESYLEGRESERLSVLDVGSHNVTESGTYKPIFDLPNWTYQGLDVVAGPNVDVHVDNPYNWKQLKSNSQDVVISGQAMEHIECFWVVMLEIERVMKPGGLCCIIAPSAGPEHRFPVDCWRFYPDGMTVMARYVCLDPLEATTQWKPLGYTEDRGDRWRDSLLVARKPTLKGIVRIKWEVKKRLLRRLAEPRFNSSP